MESWGYLSVGLKWKGGLGVGNGKRWWKIVCPDWKNQKQDPTEEKVEIEEVRCLTKRTYFEVGILGEQLRQLCYQCSQSKALNQIIKILLQVHVNIHGCLMLCSSKNKSFGCFWRNFATSRPWKVEGSSSPSVYLVARNNEWLIWIHWSRASPKSNLSTSMEGHPIENSTGEEIYIANNVQKVCFDFESL